MNPLPKRTGRQTAAAWALAAFCAAGAAAGPAQPPPAPPTTPSAAADTADRTAAASFCALGRRLDQQDRPVSAESAFRQALLHAPDDREALRGLAKSLLRQQRFAEGVALLRELQAFEPADPELWSLRVSALLRTDDPDGAALAIEQADRLGCAETEMLATLGDLLVNRDQPADALRAYERAFQEGPPPPARMLRALEGFLLLGDLEGARRMAAALRKTPLDETSGSADARAAFLRLEAERARQEGRNDAALEHCAEALRLDPLDARALLLDAEILQDAGRWEEAILDCERAGRMRGFEAEALLRQAQVEVARGHFAQAVPLLEASQRVRAQPHVARYLEQVRRLAE